MSMTKISENDLRNKLLQKLLIEINETLYFLKMREKIGLNIFKLGTLRSLPKEFQPIVYALIINPEETTTTHLLIRINLEEGHVRRTLRTLLKME